MQWLPTPNDAEHYEEVDHLLQLAQAETGRRARDVKLEQGANT